MDERTGPPRRRARVGSLSIAVLLLFALLAGACGKPPDHAGRIRLATTTSARDSGLLDVLLPAFREETGIDVQSVAVGTGEALRLGERGDADVVLVHARAAEDAFLAAGHGVERRDVWWNRFAIYGPPEDPAGLRATAPGAPAAEPGAAEALARIRARGAAFVSRGDDSGTHARERALWGGKVDRWPGYHETGQGMGPTLVVAHEKGAYVLADEGTYLRMRARLRLVPLVGSDPALRNPYGVILVREAPGARDRHASARRFVEWLTGPRAREKVRALLADGERLFWLPDETPAAGRAPQGHADAPRRPAPLGFFLDSFRHAGGLLLGGDPDTWFAIALSLWTTLLALALGAAVGVPLGGATGLFRPRGHRVLVLLFRVGMSMPTVVIGLVLYGLLSRSGPLAGLDLLYTPWAIVAGQALLAAPILASFAHAALAGLDPRARETVATHGGGRLLSLRLALGEVRPTLVATLLNAFGRCITELGIVLLVGGSLRWTTRNLPALIALETSRGEFGRALAPGLVLMGLACGAALVAGRVGRERRR